MATLTLNPQKRAFQLALEIVDEHAETGGDMQELKAKAQQLACKYGAKAFYNTYGSQEWLNAVNRAYMWQTVVSAIEEEHE